MALFLKAAEGSHRIGILAAFQLAGAEFGAVHLLGPQDESTRLSRRSAAVAVNYFLGDGLDLGLRDPQRARWVKSLAEQGFAVGQLSGGWYETDCLELYGGPIFGSADPQKWLARQSSLEGYRSPFDLGAVALPLTTDRALELAEEDRLEQEFVQLEKAVSDHAGDLNAVRLRCGLAVMADHDGIGWDGLLRGYANLHRLAPAFTAPIELAKFYAVLLEGCETSDEITYRLDHLPDPGPGNVEEFREQVEAAARHSLAARHEVEALAAGTEAPEWELERDVETIRVGDQVLGVEG